MDMLDMNLTPQIKRGVESEDREFILHGRAWAIKQVVKIRSETRDAGSTTLRKGLVLAKQTASGEYFDYDQSQAIGGQNVARAILDETVKVVDADGNPATPNAIVIFDSAVMIDKARLVQDNWHDDAKGDFENFVWADDL